MRRHRALPFGTAIRAFFIDARGVIAACVGAIAFCACAGNPAAMMSQQAETQIALGKMQDRQARAEYSDKGFYIGLIDKMQRQGLYFASLAHLDAYDQKFEPSPQSRFLRAEALRETEQDAAAVAAYRAVLDGEFSARAHHGLGLLAGRAGDFQAATTELRAALALDPTNAMAASDLGYALMRSGALQDARVPIMQALQLDGKHPKVVSNAAVWLTATGEPATAKSLMDSMSMTPAVREAVAAEARRIVMRSRLKPEPKPRPASVETAQVEVRADARP